MKLLLDSCAWGKSRQKLADAGHDVVTVTDWGPDPGDDVILNRARSEGRIVITLDKDFGELAVLLRRTHSGIIRLDGVHPYQQARVCLDILVQYGEALQQGALLTVRRDRIRIRLPEDA